MLKKYIYIFIFIIIGSIVVFQSCNDAGNIIEIPKNEIGFAGNGCFSPNIFCGTGTIKVHNSCNIENPSTIDLWVGVGNQNAGTKIGQVTLVKSNNILNVTYTFNAIEYWYVVNSIHFDIANSYESLHQNNAKNPIPGQFDYVKNFDVPLIAPGTWTFPVTLPADSAGYFYIAAHAGTSGAGVESYNQFFPYPAPNGYVTLSNIVGNFNNNGEGDSYLKLTLTKAGPFNGTYEAWCADLGSEHGGAGPFASATLYSFYETLPQWMVGFPRIEQPDNLDLVNWIINNYEDGEFIQPVSACGVPVGSPARMNAIDIQKAIWTLIDEGPGNIYEDQSNPNIVNAIVCEAQNHNGYVPSCENNEFYAFIVLPTKNLVGVDPYKAFEYQPMIVKVPCTFLPPGTGGGTAWADGKDGANFLGNNWATYFKWNSKGKCP